MKIKFPTALIKGSLLTASTIFCATTGYAQTVGYGVQRVKMQLQDIAIIHVHNPSIDPSKIPTARRPKDNRPPGIAQGEDKIVGTLSLVSHKVSPSNVFIQSGKQFNITVKSHLRSVFSGSEVYPQKTIYLTDIVYTASQQ